MILVFLGLAMLPSSLLSLSSASEYKYINHEFFDFIAILKSSGITIICGFGLYLSTLYQKNKNKRALKS